ncbi:hypothetical protein P606_13460 [Comamonas thiooxydans]|nr:hypothetical protein P606_13460 [Comamonas thiooxydans]
MKILPDWITFSHGNCALLPYPFTFLNFTVELSGIECWLCNNIHRPSLVRNIAT